MTVTRKLDFEFEYHREALINSWNTLRLLQVRSGTRLCKFRSLSGVEANFSQLIRRP